MNDLGNTRRPYVAYTGPERRNGLRPKLTDKGALDRITVSLAMLRSMVINQFERIRHLPVFPAKGQGPHDDGKP